MKDPTRMTEMEMAPDGTDVTPLELELVLAGREARLSSRDKRQIWMGISAQTLTGPVAPDTSRATPRSEAGAAATSGGAGLMAVKATILAVAIGGGSFVGVQAWQHRGGPAAPTPPATATVAPSATPAQGPTQNIPALRPSTAVPAVGPRSPATAAWKVKAQPSRLGAEGQVVLDARRTLREGRPEDALRLLDAAKTKFAAGTLVQEREALSIEALFHSGQHEAAGRRAAAFLRAYPGSPHVASVKTFARP